jgi:hypothetical protein
MVAKGPVSGGQGIRWKLGRASVRKGEREDSLVDGKGLRSGCRLVNIAASVKMFEGAEFERGEFLVKKADLGWGIILYGTRTWPLQKS